MSRHIPIIAIVAAALAAVFGTVWLLSKESAPAEIVVERGRKSAKPKIKSQPTRVASSPHVAERGSSKPVPSQEVVPPGDSDPAFTPAEQRTVDVIQDALDNDDFAKLTAQLKAASASTNAQVRAKAVEALQWFGQKALPELTMFMADEDDDVRAAAVDAWTMGLSQMDSGEAKANTVRMGLSTVTDRGQLEAMVMQVDDLTDFQKLDVLTHVIEGSNKTASEVAREHYKFWTEEDYTDLAAAQRWLDAQKSDD